MTFARKQGWYYNHKHMNPNTPMAPDQRMLDLEMKINKIYESVEKTRKYFLWTMIITVALVVLPAVGLIFAIPSFISQYSQISSLGL